MWDAVVSHLGLQELNGAHMQAHWPHVVPSVVWTVLTFHIVIIYLFINKH